MLAPWRKTMTNLDSILKKERHNFADKGSSSQSSGFPVVMYGCESWTLRKAKKYCGKKIGRGTMLENIVWYLGATFP